MTRNAALGTAAALGSALAAGIAFGADISADAFFLQRLEASDNIGFEDDAESGVGATTDLGVSFLVDGGRYTLRASPGLRFNYQSNESVEPEDVAPRLNLAASWLRPRHQITATFNFVPRPISETRFENGVSQDSDGLELNGSGSLGFLYQATRRDSFSATLTGDFNEFLEDTEQARTRSVGLSGAWRHSATPRTTLSLTPSVERFTSDSDTARDGIEYALVGGAEHAFSEALSASASAGLSVVALESGAGEDSEVQPGFTGSLGLDYAATPDTSLSLSVSQDVDQSNEGDINNTLAGGIGVTHQINDWSSIGVSGAVSAESSVLGGDEDSQTLELSSRYNYDLTRDWRVSVGYSFRVRNDEDESARANTVFLNVSRNLSLLP